MIAFVLCLAQVALAAPGTLGAMGTTRVEVSLEQAANETPARKQEIALSAIEEIAGAVREVDRMVEQASKLADAGARKDALDCLQPKSTQLHSFEGVARKAQSELTAAVSTGQVNIVDHKVRVVLVALERARELLFSARACGEGQGLVGGNQQVEVTGASESLVSVGEADAVTVEPPQASPN
jgi:hypothetical protein